MRRDRASETPPAVAPTRAALALALLMLSGLSCQEAPDVVAARQESTVEDDAGPVDAAVAPCDEVDLMEATGLSFNALVAAAQCSFPLDWLTSFDEDPDPTLADINSQMVFYNIFHSQPVDVAPDEEPEVACRSRRGTWYLSGDNMTVILCPAACEIARLGVRLAARQLGCNPFDMDLWVGQQ